MAGTTTNRALPYPTGSDALTAFPTLMQNAMTILDTHTHGYATPGSDGAPYRMEAGSANASASGTPATVDITKSFTASRFSATPMVTALVYNSSLYVIGLTAVSSTSFTVQARKASGANFTNGETVNIRWIAVQMLSGSGAG